MFSRGAHRIISISRLLASNQRQCVLKQRLHVSVVSYKKVFLHNEAALTSKFVPNFKPQTINENIQNHENFEPAKSYSNKTPDELVNEFEAIAFYCRSREIDISNDKFDNYTRELLNIVGKISDNQLMKVLYDLKCCPDSPSTYSKNFHELWTTLDDECLKRSMLWKQPMLLKVCNLWMNLHLSKINKYSRKAILKVLRGVGSLPPKALVETMFYYNIIRPKHSMIEIEMRFEQVIDELDINEVGILCLSFFKTETKIKSIELCSRIYDKTISQIDVVEDITIANILKTLRYSSDPAHARKMEELSNAVLPHVNKFSMLACLHIALLGTSLQYCHQELLESIVRRFNDKVESTRLKDIERITFVICLFDFKSESGIEKKLLEKVRAELKVRVDEIVLYPRCLASIAHYLSHCGIYDEEIIKSVLSPNFIQLTYGKNYFNMGREAMSLDGLTRINLKDTYKGPQLDIKMRAGLAKLSNDYIPYRDQKYRLSFADKLLLDTKEVFEGVYGPNVITHILPHYQRADIVLCFDENNNPVTQEFAEVLHKGHSGIILSKDYVLSRLPKQAEKYRNVKFIAVIQGSWNVYIRDTEIPTGNLKMKLEQLKMIGYEPLLIHFKRWKELSMDQKGTFLENEVKKILNS